MPYVDRPLPEDFQVPAIAAPKRKPKFMPPRKQKGAVAKITRDVKGGILNGAIAHGFDGEGLGGLDGYFQMCAARYPKHYMHLLGKLIPVQLQSEGLTSTPLSFNIISVDSGSYLSAEDIERLRAPGQMIEQKPIEHRAEPEPVEFEPRTERERRLLAELEALSPEQLLERAKQAGFIDVDGV